VGALQRLDGVGMCSGIIPLIIVCSHRHSIQSMRLQKDVSRARAPVPARNDCGSLYSHISGKQELLYQIVLRGSTQFLHAAQATITEGSPARD
jgi:hypothetical protein